MAFTIHKPDTAAEGVFIATEKLYLSRDGERIVGKTDPDVGSLLCGKGDAIPLEDARRLGLVPEVKESKPAETKEAKPEATKAVKPPLKKEPKRAK